MINIKEAYQMEEIADIIRNSNYEKSLAANLKSIRLIHYQEYKKMKKGVNNPYSLENIALLLNISKRHYTRLENPKYTSKNINLKNLLILAKIYNIPIEFFLEKNSNSDIL